MKRRWKEGDKNNRRRCRTPVALASTPSDGCCAMRSARPVFLRVVFPHPARYNTIEPTSTPAGTTTPYSWNAVVDADVGREGGAGFGNAGGARERPGDKPQPQPCGRRPPIQAGSGCIDRVFSVTLILEVE